MARHPTFDEFAKKGKYAEGIKRCDELLARSPKDVQLLTTKLQLLCASNPGSQEGPRVLEQLSAIQPAIQDLQEIIPIEIAVVESFRNTYPPPLTAGPVVAKLWENAFKANTNLNYRLDLLYARYQRAVYDNRIQDVQQTLIQLKALQPKNRAIYMAHAAYTQLLSTQKDDLQSKLAIGLARKAVSEKFDEDPALDCRVAGQIFTIQGSEKDLDGIRNRQAFRESKQVYEALQLHRSKNETNGKAKEKSTAALDPSKMPREWLDAEVEKLKAEFKDVLDDSSVDGLTSFAVKAIQLFHTATTSLNLGVRNRGAADPCFLAVSALVKRHADTDKSRYLLQSAFLVERLLNFNPHVHEARLILVYLYMRLELGSDAIRFFHSLNVKEIQHDTIGHTLFTRLSTIHPFHTQLPAHDVYDPHERTYKGLQIYPRHDNKLFETEAGVLDHSQAGMIFDLNQLRSELRQSWTRRMMLLEHRRTARFTGKGYGKQTSELGPRMVANWTNTKDNRDFNASFDFGYDVERVLHAARVVPGQAWLIYNLALDTAWSIANKQMPLILDTDNLITYLEKALEGSEVPPELMPAETLIAKLVLTLLPPLAVVKSGSSPSHQTIAAIASALDSLDFKLPEATIQDHYMYIDVLIIVVRACKFIKEIAEHIPQEVASIQAAAQKLIRDLQTNATERMTALKVGDVLGELEEGETLQRELLRFGGEKLREFAETVVESTREGWEGIGKITLPS